MTYWFAGQLYEGEQITLVASNPALAYGASVFTTMRIYGKSLKHPLTAWKRHRDRISNSLQFFDWPQPDWQDVAQGCQTMMMDYPILRLTVLANGQAMITGRPLPPNLQQQQRNGVTAWVAQGPQYRRSLPGHKTSNYLPCWLAIQAAISNQARDAILTASSGEWLETSTGNLWGYKAGQWWTPPLASGILPGISRAHLLNSLTTPTITDQPWTLELAYQFECLAYSNCVVELIPIHTVLLGNIKLNYRSTHKGLSALRQMFYSASMCDTTTEQAMQNPEMR